MLGFLRPDGGLGSEALSYDHTPYRPDERPPVFNLDDPPLKDTLAVRTGEYAILRFVADNPGMWHFHCHLIVHMNIGLQMVFNVAEEKQAPPPADYFKAQTYDGAMCPTAFS